TEGNLARLWGKVNQVSGFHSVPWRAFRSAWSLIAMANVVQQLSRAKEPLPNTFFIDARFLNRLARCPEAGHVGAGHEEAMHRWHEFLARKRQNPQMRAYWSPAVVQDFLASCALALLRLYQRRDRIPASAVTEQKLIKEL